MSTSVYERSKLPEDSLRWISGRTLLFARFWRNHKLRNLAIYSCIATRNLPIVSDLFYSGAGCPATFYTDFWSRIFEVPRWCITHDCLSRFGRAHFVYAEFVALTYQRVMLAEFTPARPDPKGKVAVIVEPRATPIFEYVVRQVMTTIGVDWSLQIFVSAENREKVQLMFDTEKGGAQEHVIITPLSQFGIHCMTQRTQSALSAHAHLYHMIVGENIFWFQVDVILRHRVPQELLEPAYLGSEFSGCEFPHCEQQRCRSTCGGGNSGLSLRRKSGMLKIANRGNLPENLWGIGSVGNFFASDVLYDNRKTKWFEDDLLFSEKLHSLGLLQYGAWQHSFAIGETLGDESLELDPVGLHRVWLVPKMDPLVVTSLLSKPAEQFQRNIS